MNTDIYCDVYIIICVCADNLYYSCPIICHKIRQCRFMYTFTPTAYATIETTIIHHVYKPEFSLRSFLPRPEVGTCLP